MIIKHIQAYKPALAFLLLTAVTISCAKKDLIKPGDSLPVAYGKAMNKYTQGKYGDAANAFEIVIRTGRGTDYAKEAQFYLADSYFKDKQYLLAASEFERYSTLYPQAAKRMEADFKEAVSYYKMSPRYKLDQKYTHKAIEKFRLYNSRYPNSENTQQAADYITELRQKLAHKTYGAADLYMRTDQYKAAIIYYDLTIDRYPESSWAELALVKEIHAYVTYAGRSVLDKQDDRYQKAVDTYEKYIQLFPNGKHRSEAESYVDNARQALAKLKDDNTATANTSDN